MFLRVAQVLDAAFVERLVDALSRASFSDGKLTAQGTARAVKDNRQLTRSEDVGAVLGTELIGVLTGDARFRSAALPRTFVRPMFARYEAGMAYGDHIDSALMEATRIRSDIAVTVFLCNRDSYQGGELVIDSAYGAVRCKGDAGDVALYPASSLHRVEEVTAGTRLVALSWVQSLVRDPAQRQILYDMQLSIERLGAAGADEDDVLRLSHCRQNLLRMWAE
jgi:PKHD-type hydroxylase